MSSFESLAGEECLQTLSHEIQNHAVLASTLRGTPHELLGLYFPLASNHPHNHLHMQAFLKHTTIKQLVGVSILYF